MRKWYREGVSGHEERIVVAAPRSAVGCTSGCYSEGTMEWKRTYGGSEDDIARAVIQITDGGFSPRWLNKFVLALVVLVVLVRRILPKE